MLNSVETERAIYAFTGKTKDEYLNDVIKAWNDYLAAGGDPAKYEDKEEAC